MANLDQRLRKSFIAGAVLTACIGVSGIAPAATTDLASAPLETASSTPVLPNVMVMLDDSGSMDWDYMPDVAKSFAGNYGFYSSQCNGTYYDPNITYAVPVTSTGTPLNATASTFAAAYRDGFLTGTALTAAANIVNLNTGYTGGSGSGASGTGLAPGPAFYYAYSGTNTTPQKKNYSTSTGSQSFNTECNGGAISGPGPAAGNAVFTPVTLTSLSTSNITIGAANFALITVGTFKSKTTVKVSSVIVNGVQLLNAVTSSSGTTKKTGSGATLAGYIAAQINAKTGTTQYVAVVGAGAAANTVTLYGPSPAAGAAVAILCNGSIGAGAACTSGASADVSSTAFPAVVASQITSLTVNGAQLLSGSAPAAVTTSPLAIATSLVTKVTATGYAAVAKGNVVTITGPSSGAAIGYTPSITAVGGMTITGSQFTGSTAAQLQNFANWYSYYSNRMLMMKSAMGLAFQPINSNYRVGFMTMNNNASPGFVDILPFTAAQKATWYSKLYAANPGNMTPLREALSHVGQLYAKKFGNITQYKATITVKCSNGSTGTCPASEYNAVDSIVVETTAAGVVNAANEGELLNASAGCPTDAAAAPLCSTTSGMAAAIAAQINATVVTDYGATVSANVVTISGPPQALGLTPLIDDNSSMSMTATPFVASTTTALLNNVAPLDPMQYSCQQNFVLLTTDGYWNGANTYNLNNAAVGNTDGAAGSTWSPEKRPMLDGLNTASTLADVAEYYYKTDLRDNSLSNCTGALGTDVCLDNVPTSTPGQLTHQNMVTFTLGLGARGTMVYNPEYMNLTTTCVPATDGDFCSILQGAPASGSAAAACVAGTAACVCPWQTTAGSVCNWTVPSASGAANNIDDLWHAAVNGRGLYFSATEPSSLATGLASALAGINSQVASSAASAVSSPIITSASNFLFNSRYTSVLWDGNVTMTLIDPATGNPLIVTNGSYACTVSGTTYTCTNINGGTFTCTDPSSTGTHTCSNPVAFTIRAKFNTNGNTETTTTDNIVTTTTAAFSLTVAGNNAANGTFACSKTGANFICPTPAGYTCTYTSGGTNYTCTHPSANTVAAIFQTDGTAGSKTTGSVVATTAVTAWTLGVQANAWSSQTLLDTKVRNDASTDITTNRTIYTFDSTSANGLKSFIYGNLTATEKAYFDNHCSATYMSQCVAASLNAAQITEGNIGLNLVNYLRGNSSLESPVAVYRPRLHIQGDSVDATPAYIGKPPYSFSDANYLAFQTAQATRQTMLYVGANDGMLHAFKADTGEELWAYIPKMVMPNLYKLADASYATNHQFYVDGSPQTMDVYIGTVTNGLSVGWHTILVGGLGFGGQGFYALDVTDPSNPRALWEICSSSTLCAISDTDMGYSYGNAATLKRSSDGKWVVLVTSGYNNTSGNGEGILYQLDVATGAILHKTSTGSGSAASPSGLAKISPWVDSLSTNNTARYVYGGDINGDIWRFDLGPVSGADYTPTVTQIASLKDASGAAQSVTTRIELGDPMNNVPNSLSGVGNPVLYVGTGRFLGVTDLTTTQVQTMYGIKDSLPVTGASYGNPRTYGIGPPVTPGIFVRNYLYLGTPKADGTQTVVSSQTGVNWTTNSGWYVDLPVTSGPAGSPAYGTISPQIDAGGRINLDPSLNKGVVIVIENVPTTDACTSGGWYVEYPLNFLNGTISPSTTVTRKTNTSALAVGYILVTLSSGKIVALVTDATGYTAPVQIGLTSVGATRRTAWRELMQ